jgi:hypothetical protein
MNSEKVYWTQRDGTQIDIDEMSEQHLRNTLKMIIRNQNLRNEDLRLQARIKERDEWEKEIHDDNLWK